MSVPIIVCMIVDDKRFQCFIVGILFRYLDGIARLVGVKDPFFYIQGCFGGFDII